MNTAESLAELQIQALNDPALAGRNQRRRREFADAGKRR